jgi:peptidoglycan/xylan/chitin deacetylase (PgdA/CDA1 family)
LDRGDFIVALVQIKPFVYVAVAGMTIGLLIVAGGIMGQLMSDPVPSTAPAAPKVAASPPSGRAGVESAHIMVGTGPYGSVTHTGTDSVALTFDDGPNPQWTPKMLEVLRDADIKATFCLIGTQVEEYPDLVRAIVADGHTVCNHSWNHNLKLGEESEDEIRDDMQRTNDAIEDAAPGTPIAYFRAPGGNWTATIVSVARELGMSSLDWTIDPQDWTAPPVSEIVDMIEQQCQAGSIVLMHDGGGDRANSIEAVREFLPTLQQFADLAPLPTGTQPFRQ